MSLFGNILGLREDALFNHQNPRNFQNVWPQKSISEADLAHLSKGGVIHHFGWTWQTKRGEKTIRVGPYYDATEGEREFIETLHECGYRLPKWWEMSRWGEKRLSKERREAIAALEAKR